MRLCFYSPCVFTQHLWFDVAGLLICAAAFLSPTPSISRNDCKPLCDIRCNFLPDFHLLLILTHICFCKAIQVFKVLCYPSIHFSLRVLPLGSQMESSASPISPGNQEALRLAGLSCLTYLESQRILSNLRRIAFVRRFQKRYTLELC